ncbi:UNVERIFIED_ORG: hypothetical protein M2435_006939, partial [Rhizobium sophorae]|nr:hypothetical protein [Rhizobium sophorae]
CGGKVELSAGLQSRNVNFGCYPSQRSAPI